MRFVVFTQLNICRQTAPVDTCKNLFQERFFICTCKQH